MKLRVVPVNLKDANDFVFRHHRHSRPTVGHKFSVGVADESGVLRGVAIVGRPIARRLDDEIEPIERFIRRELLGLAHGERAPKTPVITQWIGISLDEIQRMKDPHNKFTAHRWPLIELRMTRLDCLRWMKQRGYPEPRKSSCTFCPYHDNALWREIKTTDPQSWSQAVEIDRMIRGGVRGTTQQLFLHRSLVPLEDVDFRSAADFGQIEWGFQEECDGMCGV